MASTDTQSLLPLASEEQRKILERIEQQRERLHARSAAQRQALELRREPQAIDPDAPLTLRLLTFARLHPMAVAAAGAAAVMLGPSRLVRWAGIVMPLVSRFRR